MHIHRRPDPAAPSQESVWSYPRPPRVEPTLEVIAVDLADPASPRPGGRCASWRPATRPPTTFRGPTSPPRVLRPSAGRTWCEFKGWAEYFDVVSRQVRRRGPLQGGP
jgi:Domain of unknown function (DUF427)